MLGRSKYRAKKVEIDGIKFASGREAKRYQDLRFMQEQGEIYGLQLQVP
ncbi:MAG: DUF1064 domain-containing protein, partial [Negativicutes bacterium]|nr:DUF1064 domain-containing protein [Negativicutes bacterium]